MGGTIVGSLVTDDDDLITVVRHPEAIVVTVNQGASEPEKMPTYFFELTNAEATELRELLNPA